MTDAQEMKSKRGRIRRLRKDDVINIHDLRVEAPTAGDKTDGNLLNDGSSKL